MTYTVWERVRARTWCTITWPGSIVGYLVWRAWRNLVNARVARQAYREGLKLAWCQRRPPSPDYHWMCDDYAGRCNTKGEACNGS